MNTQNRFWTARLLVATVTLVLSGVPQMAVAQSAQAPGGARGSESSATASSQSPQNGAQSDQGIVDPSKAPLQPIPPAETLPEAPSAQTKTTEAQAQTQGAQSEKAEGAAVGQLGVTSGGPASRPAGNAIAPAKQHQYRSLLLKIGAIAAAGAAIGTVVALSKGSPSNPPGAH